MMALYHDKNKCELTIKKNTNLSYGEKHLKEIEETGISYFNDCWYIALERKPLVEKAQQFRIEWIEEAKIRLAELENMSYPKR
jgi:hypothetical protein